MYIFVENLYTMKRTTLILTCVAGMVLFAGGGNKSGKNDGKLGYSVKMYKGLQKSMEETMKDAEKALEDPEVQKQVEKALKDAAK